MHSDSPIRINMYEWLYPDNSYEILAGCIDAEHNLYTVYKIITEPL